MQDEVRGAALLVFANKQDLPDAISGAKAANKLGLHSLPGQRWCAPDLLRRLISSMCCCKGRRSTALIL